MGNSGKRISTKVIVLIGVFFCLFFRLNAQSAIHASNDTTICAGQAAQLHVTGAASYTWTPAGSLDNASSANPTATPTQTTTYVITSQLSNVDIAVNGGFESGNTGFTSSYIYALGDTAGEQRYGIGSNPQSWNQFFTNCPNPAHGGSNLLYANGALTANTPVWCETLPVTPGSTYALQGYVCEFGQHNTPGARWMVNGVDVGGSNTISPLPFACFWYTFSASWNSGVNTQATFCVYDPVTQLDGNDFGLDDISIKGNQTLTDTVVVTVVPAPVVNLGNDTAVCTGQTVILNALNSGLTYLWNTGATTATISVNSAGQYWVKVTGACAVRDTVAVNFLSPPAAIHLGNDTTYCGPFTQVLSNTAASTKWNTGVTGSSITVSNPGQYWAVDSNQCGVQRDSITISQVSVIPPALGNDTAICSAQTLILDAGNTGTAYHWNTGATTEVINVNNAGSYSVTVTYSSGCQVNDGIAVSTYQVPLSVTWVNTTCGSSNGSATANINNGNGPFTYLWTGNVTASSISNLSAGTYKVTVTDHNGCVAIDSAIINPSGANSITINASDTLICPSDSVEICPTQDYNSYQWNTGDTSRCVYVHEAGNYYLSAVDVGNCTATSNHVTVNVHQVPSVSINVSGDTLRVTVAATVQWYRNDTLITGATNTVYVATESGLYKVRITDNNGCLTFSSSIPVTTGLTDLIDDSRIKVYPNPVAQGPWIIETDNLLLGGEFEITDNNGRLVYRHKIEAIKSSINLPLQAGIYLLKVTSGQQWLVKKLVKL